MTMNRSMQPVATFFFLLVFLTIASIHFRFCNGNHDVIIKCMESEKQALSTFKKDLEDRSNRLSSWEVEDDSCKWVGVVCDNLTGHVLQLRLRNPYPSSEFYTYRALGLPLTGKINPSLLNLKHLNYLDLSLNHFTVPIPSFIGSLASLQYLNLSEAGFFGTIPHQLGNLSSLRFLSLEGIGEVENLQWLLGLSHLEHLDLTYVNLTRVPNWLQVMNQLPSLVELRLSGCELEGPFPKVFWNMTSLEFLDLSFNNLKGSFPLVLLNTTSLQYIDLSSNQLEGSFPVVLLNMTSLQYLNLSSNELEGPFPMVLLNMTSLQYLDLSFNKLEGRLPKSLGNLCNLSFIGLSYNNFSGELFRSSSKCAVYALETLLLNNNHLSEHLPDQLEQFKNVRHLELGANSVSGSIPVTIEGLESIEILNLAGNQLNGTLPQSLGHLSKLQKLDVSNNLLEGIVSEVHFSNLINLRELHASGNQLSLKVSRDWIPPFQLEAANLASWNLGPKFPIWLQSQKDLSDLNLSNTRILDEIPIWFWNLSSSLYFLDLSNNQIYGQIPYLLTSERRNIFFGKSTYPLHPPKGQSIFLNSNHFSGPLPRISSYLKNLDLSNNSFSGGIFHFLCERKDNPKKLAYLNLRENLLSGEIPDCWMSWKSLRIIEMGNNNLTRNIPSSMGLLLELQSLHLRNNHLSGEISLSLQNCTNLLVVDLSENEFQGSIPIWMGESLPNLSVLTLRSNKLDGVIPPELCRLSSLHVLDLANNNLSGAIPWCINNFTAMVVKQKFGYPLKYTYSYTYVYRPTRIDGFSENALLVTKGNMYQYGKTLDLVASMDLSDNNISGQIPEELTSLQGLRSLNLSGNHLTGMIPKNIGNMGLLESLDLSRNQLCCEIPPSMSSLNFLGYLNLSYNNFTGKIPSSTQLQTFNASSFIGNKLCGLPLTKNCSVNGKTPDVGNEGDSEGARSEVDWFYLFMATGFAVGFWGVSAPILFIKSWRYAYFQFLNNVWTRLVLLYMSKCV